MRAEREKLALCLVRSGDITATPRNAREIDVKSQGLFVTPLIGNSVSITRHKRVFV